MVWFGSWGRTNEAPQTSSSGSSSSSSAAVEQNSNAPVVKEMKGDYGLTYCIPVGDIPNKDFFTVNEMAGINTFDAVMKVARMENPPFPVAKAEKEHWDYIYWRNHAYAALGVMTGGGLGYVSAPRLMVTHYVNAERMMHHSRTMSSMFGVVVMSSIMMYFDTDGHYQHTTEALQYRTPLGDHARVTFHSELQKDLGHFSTMSGLYQLGTSTMTTVNTFYDASVPGSIRNLWSNL
eukprot:TRINITY_DN3676_c0_g1_i1.p1 TRINITY_DN3676_c0_g1~~TRINITY_DN3676_c0_g1_i1.p1  ORF type:complete len:235 (+),score=42.92 TRINITY_DN3676_c0_g1_i1:136-840(+)